MEGSEKLPPYQGEEVAERGPLLTRDARGRVTIPLWLFVVGLGLWIGFLVLCGELVWDWMRYVLWLVFHPPIR